MVEIAKISDKKDNMTFSQAVSPVSSVLTNIQTLNCLVSYLDWMLGGNFLMIDQTFNFSIRYIQFFSLSYYFLQIHRFHSIQNALSARDSGNWWSDPANLALTCWGLHCLSFQFSQFYSTFLKLRLWKL